MLEAGIMLALAIVLGEFVKYSMPMGGSVTLGGMALLFLPSGGAGKRFDCRAVFGMLDS